MKFNLTDNVVTQALSKICDMVCLNLLWLLCSIPLVTIGASTTAMYTVMLKMVKNEEGYIFRGFFKAFKENFRQSTIIWLILVLLSIVWWVDFRFASMLSGTMGVLFKGIFLILGFVLLAVTIYVFPLTARYVNSIQATVKNALILTIAKLPYTLVMVVILIAAVLASLWNVRNLILSLPLWAIFGVSLVVWMNSHILRRVFVIFEDNKTNAKEEEEE